MNYEKKYQIEDWFRWKNADFIAETKKMDEFFETHVEQFWKNLDLMGVIETIRFSKTAAYTAYHFNYANFRNFCNDIWQSDTIDYRKFNKFTIIQFNIIQKLFHTKTLILPGYMPRNILSHMSKYINQTTKHITFYTCNDSNNALPLLRPPWPIRQPYLKITINGKFDLNMTNYAVEILFTFREVSILELNSVCLTKCCIAALFPMKFNVLILNCCNLFCTKDVKSLAETIFKHRLDIKKLHIGYEGYTVDTPTLIHTLLKKCFLLKNTHTISLSMRLRNFDLELLSRLNKCKALENLNIFEIKDKYNLDRNLFIRKLNLKLNVKILDYTYIKPLL